MPDVIPHLTVDLREVITRNETAVHILAGFAAATPALAETCKFLQAALADVPLLAAEVTRLSDQVQETRLDRANLLAAAQATIAAHHDGEPDPLSYLTDELDARTMAPTATRRLP
jgi:hypothetical protein